MRKKYLRPSKQNETGWLDNRPSGRGMGIAAGVPVSAEEGVEWADPTDSRVQLRKTAPKPPQGPVGRMDVSLLSRRRCRVLVLTLPIPVCGLPCALRAGSGSYPRALALYQDLEKWKYLLDRKRNNFDVLRRNKREDTKIYAPLLMGAR